MYVLKPIEEGVQNRFDKRDIPTYNTQVYIIIIIIIICTYGVAEYERNRASHGGGGGPSFEGEFITCRPPSSGVTLVPPERRPVLTVLIGHPRYATSAVDTRIYACHRLTLGPYRESTSYQPLHSHTHARAIEPLTLFSHILKTPYTVSLYTCMRARNVYSCCEGVGMWGEGEWCLRGQPSGKRLGIAGACRGKGTVGDCSCCRVRRASNV